MKEKGIVLKTSENSLIKVTGEIFFLQLLLGRHFESAPVHACRSTGQEISTGSCDLMPRSIHHGYNPSASRIDS